MLDKIEVTNLFLASTICIFLLAIIIGLLLVCCSRCYNSCLRRKRGKRRGKKESNSRLRSSKGGDITIGNDFDFIDDKSIDLFSSTVQVKSLHNTSTAVPRIAEKIDV